MHIKRGDIVKVMAGKDKGKSGKVIQVFPKDQRVVIEGVNVMSKHAKTKRRGDKGQKIEFAAPIAANAAQLLCPKCSKTVRTEMKTLTSPEGKDRKVRVCKKCREAVE
jgi:large subunit ribosomal protein L24